MVKPVFDPTLMPVEGLAGEAPLAPELLGAAAVRARFARTLPWNPEASDEALAAPQLRLRRAAVLVPLVERPEGLTVLLTKRTEHLSSLSLIHI